MTWHYLLLIGSAFGASLLTFYSGFGLGTLLTPVFMLFMPTEAAIAATGIVHLLNGLFKLGLTYRQIHGAVLLRFGPTAIVGALAGAALLGWLGSAGQPPEILRWTFAGLLVFFSMMELIPFLKKLSFSARWLPIGGLLSGFFGGLSGHQGALRSAFLLRTNMSKENLIATGVAIAALIDLSRLPLYANHLWHRPEIWNFRWGLVMACLAAFSGAWLGNRYLKKVTLKGVQTVIAAALLLMAVAIALGWV